MNRIESRDGGRTKDDEIKTNRILLCDKIVTQMIVRDVGHFFLNFKRLLD
jgi:hypothetical protein